MSAVCHGAFWKSKHPHIEVRTLPVKPRLQIAQPQSQKEGPAFTSSAARLSHRPQLTQVSARRPSSRARPFGLACKRKAQTWGLSGCSCANGATTRAPRAVVALLDTPSGPSSCFDCQPTHARIFRPSRPGGKTRSDGSNLEGQWLEAGPMGSAGRARQMPSAEF